VTQHVENPEFYLDNGGIYESKDAKAANGIIECTAGGEQMHFHAYNTLTSNMPTSAKTHENFDRVCHVIPVGQVEIMPRCEETISTETLRTLETPP